MSDVKAVSDTSSIGILGAGLTGLTAAYFLRQKGANPWLVESAESVGGLARTVKHRGFRFDLGGHRFLTDNRDLELFVRQLLLDRYRVVKRSSNIYFNNSFVNYPLQAGDALANLGFARALRVLGDYFTQKCRIRRPADNLQDWVTRNFGRSLFEIFFRDYSEKVWGIDCSKIDSDWIAQRIQNLSLMKTISAMLITGTRRRYATFTDQFIYPSEGIGSLCDQLISGMEPENVRLSSSVRAINHSANKIDSIIVNHNGAEKQLRASQYISTLPLSLLVKLLNPTPPSDIVEAAMGLRSRDLLLVCLMINRDKVTDDSWIYFPGKDIPFGRIHEPKNWSERMAPAVKTAVVAEYFCFKGDETWACSDTVLANTTIDSLAKLGFINNSEVFDTLVLRIPNAYPLFEVGYRQHCQNIARYLQGFGNLQLAGRTGSFRYYNMDKAMLSGIQAAEQCLGQTLELSEFVGSAGAKSQADDLTDQKGEANEVCAAYSRLAT